MLIDWFTVIAQIINFLILAWLLKRYLYDPILIALDEREKKIASQLSEAEQAKNEARKEQQKLQDKNIVFDRQRKELFTKASEEAAEEKHKLLDMAHKESEILRSDLWKALKEEHNKLTQGIKRKTKQEVFAIVKKTFSSLASSDLEENIVKMFIKKLRELDNSDRNLLESALKLSHNQIRLRSASELGPPIQNIIVNAVDEMYASKISVQFEVDPELIGGIELIAHGYKLAWNISDYITSMEDSITHESAS